MNALPSNQDRVFFGAWVTLEDGRGALATYRIVGADEIDTHRGWISVDSPMARAILKRELDDLVSVATPSGPAQFTIAEIRYTESPNEG